MRKIWLVICLIAQTIFLLACQRIMPFTQLDSSITVEGPIEISIDGKDFVKTLTDSHFDQYLSRKYPSFEFIPVTTQTGTSPFYLVDEDKIEVTNKGYLEIPIYIRSTDMATVQWKSASLNSLPIPWISECDFISGVNEVLTGEELKSTVSNAIRISIEGEIDEEESIVVYERPSGYHHNNVLNNGGNLSNNGDGNPGYLSYHKSLYGSLLFGSDEVVVPATVTEIRESNNIMLTDLKPVNEYYMSVITIRIWVERWDPDSYPAILNQDFSLSFVFVGKRS